EGVGAPSSLTEGEGASSVPPKTPLVAPSPKWGGGHKRGRGPAAQGGRLVSRTLSGLQAGLLGAAVLVGGGLIAVAVFAVGSRQWFWNDALTVRAGFPSVQGVEVGTRVRIRGMDAGEVVALETPASTEGQVMMRLRVQGKFRHLVRKNAVVQIVSVGMLGAKAVEINPGTEDQELAAEGALLASRPATELTDVVEDVKTTLKDVKTTVKDVVEGKGTLGLLAKDPEVYSGLVGLIRQTQGTMQAFQQDAEALKKVPLVGGLVEDPQALLVRPRHKKNRQVFREDQLFEPGEAVLTSGGRAKLDDLRDWFEGLKEKKSEVVVVSYADTRSVDSARARRVTAEQAKAVVDYLKENHKIQKVGRITWRKVTALGMGVGPPPN